jgi:hypothetical protein
LSTTVVVIFAVHEVLHAIQAWHLKNMVMRASASGLSLTTGDITGGAASTPYILVSWAGRFNGIAFLLYCAWAYSVPSALGLWVGTLVLGTVMNTVIRIATGYGGIIVVANIATLGVPVAGVAMWVAALGSR